MPGLKYAYLNGARRLPLHRLRNEMPPLPVLDLDHPQVRIIPPLPRDIGVQFVFAVGRDGLDPQAVAVGSEGFGEQAGGASGGVVGLDDDRAGAGVAFLTTVA